MFRIPLKTLLLFLSTVAIVIAISVWFTRSSKQKETVDWIGKRGGYVLYDFQWTENLDDPLSSNGKTYPDFTPSWLIDLFGYDFFCDVHLVCFHESNSLRLDYLDIEPLSDLRALMIYSDFDGADTNRFRELRNLRVLDVPNMTVSSPEFFEILKKLKKVRIATVTNGAEKGIAGLKDLSDLLIFYCSEIESFKFLEKLNALKNLSLCKNCKKLNSLNLTALNRLEYLEIGKEEKLNGLKNLPPSLRNIRLTCSGNRDYSELPNLKHLVSLELNDCYIDSLPNSNKTPSLRAIGFYKCRFDNLHGLQDSESLDRVFLRNSVFRNQNNLAAFRKVKELTIYDCKQMDYQKLIELKNLEQLRLLNCQKIDLTVCAKIPNLKVLCTKYMKYDQQDVSNLLESKPDLIFTATNQ